MGGPQEEIEATGLSRRKRIGRMLFLLGLAIIVIDIIASLFVSTISAYSGLEIPVANYEYLYFFIIVAGILMVIAGLAAALLPEGPSRDGVWIMMLGPFTGNN